MIEWFAKRPWTFSLLCVGALLFCVFVWPGPSEKGASATLIGSALGAFIAVTAASSVAGAEQRRTVRLLTNFYADTAGNLATAVTEMAENLGILSEASDLTQKQWDSVQQWRLELGNAVNIAKRRMHRASPEFFKMSDEAVSAIHTLDVAIQTIETQDAKSIGSAAPVGHAYLPGDQRRWPNVPEYVKVLREQATELGRVKTCLRGVAREVDA